MDSSLPPNYSLEIQHWIHGLLLQTIVYGLNIAFFLTSSYVLLIHIFKAIHSHRFHKRHLYQNCILLVYAVVMFAFSTLTMVHQGGLAVNGWGVLLAIGRTPGDSCNNVRVLGQLSNAGVTMQKACNVVFLLVNWGTVGLLLWRCLVHWKVNSIFPSEILALPYIVFAACAVTGLLELLQAMAPSGLSRATESIKWPLVHWSLSTALYYLLSFLIVARILHHRHVFNTQLGKHHNRFTSCLTIVIESGVLLLIFAMAQLVVLARFPHLRLLFHAPLVQVQVLITLMIIQRIAAGKAWSGKTVDCLLQRDPKPPSLKAEELSAMGFNPNTECSYTQNDDLSHTTNKAREHELTIELQPVIDRKV